jgi:hypothetical protein
MASGILPGLVTRLAQARPPKEARKRCAPIMCSSVLRASITTRRAFGVSQERLWVTAEEGTVRRQVVQRRRALPDGGLPAQRYSPAGRPVRFAMRREGLGCIASAREQAQLRPPQLEQVMRQANECSLRPSRVSRRANSAGNSSFLRPLPYSASSGASTRSASSSKRATFALSSFSFLHIRS